MSTNGIYDYQPHPEIASVSDLRAFHDEVSVWNQLVRNGINPLVFTVAFTLAVVTPGAVLAFGYGVDHPLATGPMLVVLACNTALTVFATLFIDTRFPRVVEQIRPSFDVDDETYYGFFGRFFERLYHLSFFSPLARGPNGRSHRPTFWVSLGATYVGWAVALGVVLPTDLPAALPVRLLAVGYFLFVVGFATMTLFTATAFVAITGLYLAVRITDFTIQLNPMLEDEHYGLEPFGRFLFHTLFIGLAMVATAGGVGLVTRNPVLWLFTVLGTPLVLVWFVGSQYGIHRAIVNTKRARLRRLHERYAEQMDRTFLNSTPEPDIDAISRSESFVRIKDHIRELPNWPTDTRTVYHVVTTALVSNIPSAIGIIITVT
jgi:hypothetical protein